MNLSDPGFLEFFVVVAAGLIVGWWVYDRVEKSSKEKAARLEVERLEKKYNENLYLWLNKEEDEAPN